MVQQQERKTKRTSSKKTEQVDEAAVEAKPKSSEELITLSDELMAEIDELLENSDVDPLDYVNKGGQ